MRTKRRASPTTFRFDDDEFHNTETAIVLASSTTTTTSRGFTVPEHWIVKEHKRITGPTAGEVYKQYYEPETGLMFRSLRSVQKYLLGSEVNPPGLKLLDYGKKDGLPKRRKVTALTSYNFKRDPSFKLPEGWLVEECVRSSGLYAGRADRYYIEPKTGVKFRSMKSMEAFLAKSKYKTPALEMLPFDEEKFRLKATSFNLPKGWRVEEYVCSYGIAAGSTMKVYIEPGTGRKFQSLESVEMHLSHMNGSLVPTQTEFLPENYNMLSSADVRKLLERKDMASGAQSSWISRRGLNYYSTSKEVPCSDPDYDDIIFNSPQCSGSFKNKVCEGMLSSSSNEAPAKIKWKFSGKDCWNPFVGETMVPEPVQQQWAKLFVSIVDEGILMHKSRSR